uniref:Lipid-binding serum glycoprotein C-terminal domain-containing protein n=1 Tax=Romanomermis culicivorax TaxID=13658 RepID=A0A915I7L6_ROMCU
MSEKEWQVKKGKEKRRKEEILVAFFCFFARNEMTQQPNMILWYRIFGVGSLIIQCLCQIDYRPEVLPAPGKLGDSGIQIKFTEKFVQYASRVSGDLLNQGITKFKFPTIIVNVPGGSATLSNVKVKKFKSADSYTLKFSPKNKISYKASNMDATIQGFVTEKIFSSSDAGVFLAEVTGVSLEVSVLVQRQNQNPKLQADYCRLNIDRIKVKLSDMQHKALENFFNNRIDLQNRFLPTFEVEACSALKQLIEKRIGAEISKRSTKEPLIFDSISPSANSTLIQRQMNDIFKKVYFDRSLTKDPVFGYNVADFWLKGECSWQGLGSVPFGPSILYDDSFSKSQTNNMARIIMSDHVINSLLYSAYKNRALIFKINKLELSDYGKFLRSSCPDGEICVGKALPEISKKYPNVDMQINLNASKAPAIVIRGGDATIFWDTLVVLLAGKDQLADMDLYVEAEYTPILVNNILKGQITLKKFDGRLRNTSIKMESQDLITVLVYFALEDFFRQSAYFRDITQEKIDDWAKTASLVVETMINDQLEYGIPLPQNRMIQMQPNSQLTLSDRRLRLDVDLQANVSATLDLIQKYVDKEANGRIVVFATANGGAPFIANGRKEKTKKGRGGGQRQKL